MKNLFFAFTLLALISCGKTDTAEKCLTREAKRHQCQAEELAKNSHNNQYQLDYAKQLCERLYQVQKCYSVEE